MSINDYKSAIIQLVRSNELFLAFILAYLLYQDGIKDVVVRLARKAERSMIPKEAKELLEMVADGTQLEKALMLSRFSKLGLYQQDQYEEEKYNSAAIEGLPSNVQQVVQEILGGSVESACEMCSSQFDEVLETEDYQQMANCIQMYEALQEVQISKCSQENKNKVFCHLSIIGLCKALWHGYVSVIPGLFN